MDEDEQQALTPLDQAGADGITPRDKGKIQKWQVVVTIILALAAGFGIKGIIVALVERPIELEELKMRATIEKNRAELHQELVQTIQQMSKDESFDVEWPEIENTGSD